MNDLEKRYAALTEVTAKDPIAGVHAIGELLDDAMARIRELEQDAALGRLVRQKMLSGNNVSVERCVIRDEEIAAIDAARGS